MSSTIEQPALGPDAASPARTGSTRTVLIARVGAVVAAAGFVTYPALRPYSSETGLVGARAFGSTQWVTAHVIGMLAFGALAVVTISLNRGWIRTAMTAGVAAILPYYGAEAFGLHAIGRTAVARSDASLTAMADVVRNNPAALTMFGAGLLLIAAAGIGFARRLWIERGRTAAVLIALGTVGYLPQFYAPPAIRIAHGIVFAVGLLALAVLCGRATRRTVRA